MTAHDIFFSKFGLLASIANPFASNFLSEYKAQSNRLVYAKGICSLVNAVLSIFSFVSKFQVVWTNARPIMFSGTFMKHKHSLWNRPFIKNVTDNVSSGDWGFQASGNATAHLAVSVMQTSSPNPASGFWVNSNLFKESLKCGFGKFLRSEINGVSIWLHNVSQLALCRALGYASNARAISFSHFAGLNAT